MNKDFNNIYYGCQNHKKIFSFDSYNIKYNNNKFTITGHDIRMIIIIYIGQ